MVLVLQRAHNASSSHDAGLPHVARCSRHRHRKKAGVAGGIGIRSQRLRFLAPQDWRPMLDEAVEHFRDAGCAPPDIRGALKNHYRAADLDLGPDPEPQPEKVRAGRCSAHQNLSSAAFVLPAARCG